MRVLLDECLPRPLRGELTPHAVSTVPEMGWASFENGDLLKLAEGTFDVFLTMDKALPEDQEVARFAIAVVLVRARSNRLEDLQPLVPAIQEALSQAAPGRRVVVGEM